MKKMIVVITLGLFALYSFQAHASLFNDNMVLQRNEKLPVWGFARKGEKVKVKFHGAAKTAITDDKGRWLVEMGPFPAGGPYEMEIIRESSKRKFKNIMIGEVWLCSGQSNMQKTLTSVANADAEIAAANHPNIRFITISGTASGRRSTIASSNLNWFECTPKTASKLSAVAYFFARALEKKLKVPIGLVVTAQGSSPIRSWISRETMLANPVFKKTLESYKTFPERKKKYFDKRKAYFKALAESKKNGTKAPKWPGFFENEPSPGQYFYGRIYPLAPFAIKGVVWYQGENDALFHHADTYEAYFMAMIKEWRSIWKTELPFLYVQLAPLSRNPKKPVESDWAKVCDAQRKVLALPKTAMVVTSDICEVELHPKKKTKLGERLATAAEALAYGKKNIVYSGPIYKAAIFADGAARLTFTETHGGLVAKNGVLEGFTIAGADKKFFNAKARMEGNTVVVTSTKVKNPEAVRYAWSNNLHGTLFNKEGYPASCFRTDNW